MIGSLQLQYNRGRQAVITYVWVVSLGEYMLTFPSLQQRTVCDGSGGIVRFMGH